jgi:hypothetical protein
MTTEESEEISIIQGQIHESRFGIKNVDNARSKEMEIIAGNQSSEDQGQKKQIKLNNLSNTHLKSEFSKFPDFLELF